MPKATSSELLISKTAQFTRLASRLIEKGLQPIGLTFQEMRIAGLLMGEEQLTQKQLAEKLSVRAATLSVAISKLEKQGMVKRTPSTEDKRVNFLSVTKNIEVSEVDELLQTLEASVCHGVQKSDLAITKKVIKQLIENTEKLNAERLTT